MLILNFHSYSLPTDIKKPPTLASYSGVPENVISEAGQWMEDVCSMQKPPRPFTLGTVLTMQVPNASSKAVKLDDNTFYGAAGVTSNAAAVFKDKNFDVSCPCQISISCSLVLEGKAKSNLCQEEDGEAAKELVLLAASEARYISQQTASKLVENIGKRRIEDIICEDRIQNVRTQRNRQKAERLRRREMEQRKLIAEAAKPLIQRAVASIKTKNENVHVSNSSIDDHLIETCEESQIQCPRPKDNNGGPRPCMQPRGANAKSKVTVSTLESVFQNVSESSHRHGERGHKEQNQPGSEAAGNPERSKSQKISIHNLDDVLANRH